MIKLLTLSRAARLVGVTRGALQKKIKDGELSTFEGMVRAQDLLRVYPQARLEDDTLFEHLTQLKEGAFARRLRERILPDPEVLAVRLAELGRELATVRAELARYRTMAYGLDERLAALVPGVPDVLRPALEALHRQLRDTLESAPEDGEHHVLAVRDSFMRVMVAHVLVLPSHREFFVEGSDTLLEAALRAGLALNYGCSNGNCGLCKARLVSGQAKKVRNHDYVLTEAEKARGTLLMCCHTAVTDCVIEAEEAGGAYDIPLQQIATRVKAIERLGPETALLHLQTPRTRRLRFLAGQYVTLQAGDGPAVDYPVASCPCDDRNLQFHVTRAPDNAFAARVFGDLKSGDTVNLLGPRGEFVLRSSTPHTLVFIAWDTGFAPIKSLIEHAMALDVAETLHLYWLASPGRGHYLDNLCRSWSDALDNFHYTPLVLAEDAATDSAQVAGALGAVFEDHPALRDCEVYVAGSATLLDAARAALLAKGLPPEQLVLGYPR
jgi:CDP-4-dehydro-6-deoxyglucose reductase